MGYRQSAGTATIRGRNGTGNNHSASGVWCMKMWRAAFWTAAFVAMAALQAGPASAGPWRELRAAQDRPDRYDRGASRQRDAGQPDRFQRQDRPQRMSDEERRGLHRDLDKARREIYKPRPERGTR
jgi:hypothetical protein